ncbi:hypothetical protein NYR30_04145 [Gallibacterium salpingitidis]|uniref:hypothetical protein n=1 Tax=Gallibacterium salpingitidis TaxID=505341 RepID=UPI00266FD4C3|nr:hypothetical protein [Gallibacterium salpingitidis]WKT00485.1 hypothetical protein NYR30_04145 [Gallibacterium salpingitidis]
MGNIKRYKVKLDSFDFDLEADWEIDFDFELPDWLKEEAGIKTVTDVITEIYSFWNNDADIASFEEQLNYVLKHATIEISRIYNRSFRIKPEDLTRQLFENVDGFALGECGIRLYKYKEDLNLNHDILDVYEIGG